MKATEFCFWLQGYFEIQDTTINGCNMGQKSLNPIQVATIQRHLELVFHHDIDPKQGTPEHQAELQAIHDGQRPPIGGTGPNGERLRC